MTLTCNDTNGIVKPVVSKSQYKAKNHGLYTDYKPVRGPGYGDKLTSETTREDKENCSVAMFYEAALNLTELRQERATRQTLNLISSYRTANQAKSWL